MKSHLYSVEKCPACNTPAETASFLFNVSIMSEQCTVIKCRSCKLIYKNLFPTVDETNELYNEEYVHFQTSLEGIDAADFKSGKQKLDRCHKLLNSRSSHTPKLIDVGCGSGKFVEIARKLNYSAEGIDPYLPANLECSYLKRILPEQIPENSYDIAVLLNVAEHLAEPKEVLQSIGKILRPGGVLLLTCPYGNSLARKIYKGRWSHLSLDEHLLFWTPASLNSLLKDIGFSDKVSYRISGAPFPYGRSKLAKSNTTESLRQDSAHSHRSDDISQLIQSKIWKLGREIQRNDLNAKIVRALVDITHTGDYLEYAIKLK